MKWQNGILFKENEREKRDKKEEEKSFIIYELLTSKSNRKNYSKKLELQCNQKMLIKIIANSFWNLLFFIETITTNVEQSNPNL